MDSIIDSVAGQLFSSGEIEFEKEELFLALLTCKNLADLCETATAILDGLTESQKRNLPTSNSMNLSRSVLGTFFSESMFIENDAVGLVPNWNEIDKMKQSKKETACQVYRKIKANMLNDGTKKAIEDRDEKWFVDNFEEIFAGLPGQLSGNLDRFKNFILSPHITVDEKECIWDYFNSILYVFEEEEENIALLKKHAVA